MTADHPALARALVRELQERGGEAALASSQLSAAAHVIVTTGVADGDPFERQWQTLDLARTLRAAGCRRLVLLQDTGGTFSAGPSGGWAGGLTGLAKTAAREWPDITIGVIDIALDAGDVVLAAKHVAAAIGDDRLEIGIDGDGTRTTCQLGPPLSPPSSESASRLPSESQGVWLVSGGARGVTSACVIELARRTGGRFALLGRSTPTAWPGDLPPTDDVDKLRALLVERAAAQERPVKPAGIERELRSLLASREVERTLSAIRATGADVRYETVDLGDPSEVLATVARVRDELGPITGLIHGAGVLADQLIANMTRDQFDRVFAAKVRGLQALLDALDLPSLRRIALFSSASGYFGNVGQANYAMANAILNRVARGLRERLPDAMVKSFNWGPWDGGMVDQKLARHFKAKGIGLIPKSVGSRLFVDHLLYGHPDQVELVIGDR